MPLDSSESDLVDSPFYRVYDFIQTPGALKRVLLSGFTVALARGYDSVIRRMNILVCSGMDFMCALSTFALELEDK